MSLHSFFGCVLRLHRLSRGEKNIGVTIFTREYGIIDIFIAHSQVRRKSCDIGSLVEVIMHGSSKGSARYTLDGVSKTISRSDMNYREIADFLELISLMLILLPRGEPAMSLYDDYLSLYDYRDTQGFSSCVFFLFLRIVALCGAFDLKQVSSGGDRSSQILQKLTPLLRHNGVTSLMKIEGILSDDHKQIYKILTPYVGHISR